MHFLRRDEDADERTVDLTTLYDEASFDPEFENEPPSTFEPMARRVLSRDWTPPTERPLVPANGWREPIASSIAPPRHGAGGACKP